MQIKKRLKNIWLLYYEGFRDMTVGRRLWAIILIKLFIMFAILKMFFFPNFMNNNFESEEQRSSHIIEQLTEN